ncbi:hypothetical protein SAMN04488001_3115 [Litoreibacter albidus]|uniref:Uncharacterized protein n=1 Tax=Litoreibacter albidus TaxID=670155 RepID=A0A1H3BEF5_9RHOB|nr:hypothetical protein SAMN04488001_3115 [Litoreibacter albidus]
MIAVFRSQSNARLIIQPKPPLLWLFHWYFQPLPSLQSFDALVIHMPASISPQCSDPTIAVAAILPGQFDHIGHQSFFTGTTCRHFALRRSMLSQNAARAALRDIQLSTNTINASTTASGA